MLKQSLNFIAAPLIFLAAFFSTALAAGALTPDDNVNLWVPVWEAFRHGQHAYAGALALVALVALARLYGQVWIPWLRTDQGGASLALFGALGVALGASLADGAGLTWGILQRAVVIAVGAAGGYSLIKRLVITPYVVPLSIKYPALQSALGLLLAIFNVPEDKPENVTTKDLDAKNS